MDDIKNNNLSGAAPEEFKNEPENPVKPKKPGIKGLLRPKNVLLALVFVLFTAGGWFGFRIFNTWRNIAANTGNEIRPPALTQDVNQLKGEGDGRINVLVLGMGGSGHSGGKLADTIMVVSVDPETGHLAMLSLPRDLWVPIGNSGSFSKINFAYAKGGPKTMKQTVSNILDITIHYYVTVDFRGFEKVVDTVGGVTVNNKQALYDNSYPCDGLRGYCPFSLAKGKHKLNGKTALKYARCRKGTCGNDFGRASRQQEVVLAIGEKLKSSETLLNPLKIDKVLSSLGSHVRTDVSLKELVSFIDIGKKIDRSNMKSQVLTNQANSYLVSGFVPGGGYVLKPKTGNFKAIQQFAHKLFVDPFLKKENARIELQNGSLANGLATQLAKMLKNYSYNIVKVGEADRRDYRETKILDYSGGKKPYTIKYLELRFNVKAEVLAKGDERTSDILVIVGNDYRP